MTRDSFLPVSREDMARRGWYYCDFIIITGDAYVDHPSFGTAIISRLLESLGYRVGIISQPDCRDEQEFLRLGRPRYAVLINSGNVDSMVAHYTVAKKRRKQDMYSPGGKSGLRPDRACSVYSKTARKVFGPDMPIILGGIEASLRRFSHYDYWADKVLPSILFDSGADGLMYGMGEKSMSEIAARLKKGAHGNDIFRDVRGSAYISADISHIPFEFIEISSYEKTVSDKRAYALNALAEHDEQDPFCGRAVVQPHGECYLIQNPPSAPASVSEMDFYYSLPYTRYPHPDYDSLGGVPAIKEVQFSITHNRGCFGDCSFCSLAFHQGRYISVRSHESVLNEIRILKSLPSFKGYIHDIGGPTANFRSPSCDKQKKSGFCKNRRCLYPSPCENLIVDHSDYLSLLRKARETEGIKKVFIRSGLRFDYIMADKNGEFMAELVHHHVSGQLKVAPEHICPNVLRYMGKPSPESFEAFKKRFDKLNHRFGTNQYILPYLMSSHPGSTLDDAVQLALYMKRNGIRPEQVQDFYPTPGTLSTAMYCTGLDPRTMQPVYVAKDPREKNMQRALLQWYRPELRSKIHTALTIAGRTDLIGHGKNCLVP